MTHTLRAPFALAAVFALATGACDSAAEPASDLVVTATDAGLRIETERDYPCSNYPLVVDADVSDGRADVRVRGVGTVDVCLDALGPATAAVAAPSLAARSDYRVTLRKGRETDRYVYACGFAGCWLRAEGPPSFSRVGPR